MSLSERAWQAHARRLSLRILELRAERGWSQEKLADEAGISRSLVQFVETGRKSRARGAAAAGRTPFNPTLRTLYALAGAFGVSIPDLLGD